MTVTQLVIIFAAGAVGAGGCALVFFANAMDPQGRGGLIMGLAFFSGIACVGGAGYALVALAMKLFT